MTSQTEKAKAKLATLFTSLDDLEAHLEPLFAQTLPETLLALEPIQQAKLQTVLPYLVYDLVFSAFYLKSRGIDPRTHSVVPELDRVKQYFDKINNAENPPTKRTEIDKAAAGRFIKHAITQAVSAKRAPEDSAFTIPEPSTSAVRVPGKITSKMLERQQYEKELREQDGVTSDEDELAIFGDDDTTMNVDSSSMPTSLKKGKGKEKLSVIQEPVSQPGSKRKRPAVDPFAGYGDDLLKAPDGPTDISGLKRSKSNEVIPSCSSSTTETKAKRGKEPTRDAADSTPKPAGLVKLPEASSNQGSLAPGTVDVKKAKKAKKKARKSLTNST